MPAEQSAVYAAKYFNQYPVQTFLRRFYTPAGSSGYGEKSRRWASASCLSWNWDATMPALSTTFPFP